MSHGFNKLVQWLIPPRVGDTVTNRLLQRVRRKSFRADVSVTEGYFSQAGQDKFLNEVVFKGKRNGVFVDVGAGDGVFLSNTYFLESKLGWSGICVEPRSNAFAKLISKRSCSCVQGCVTDFSGYGSFLEVTDVPLLSGLISKYDSRHIGRIRRELGASGKEPIETQVRCFTFDELTKNHHLSFVDYLSIDTEGGELDLLQSIDFSLFAAHVVSVENAFSDGRFEKIMKQNGYQLVAVIGDDDIYVRMESDTRL